MDKVAAESLRGSKNTAIGHTCATGLCTVPLENYLADQRSALLRKRSSSASRMQPSAALFASFTTPRLDRDILRALNSSALCSRLFFIERSIVSLSLSLSLLENRHVYLERSHVAVFFYLKFLI